MVILLLVMTGASLTGDTAPSPAGNLACSELLGAGMALLLDQEGPSWKARYLADKFFLERYAARNASE